MNDIIDGWQIQFSCHGFKVSLVTAGSLSASWSSSFYIHFIKKIFQVCVKGNVDVLMNK